jgi:2-polyprenyl-6-hydroxyphenyl methylase/3-demethylubiquinone-9 3-methyltransferase
MRVMEEYEFNQCKCCGRQNSRPKYNLKNILLYVCPDCDFHYTNILDDLEVGEAEARTLTDNELQFIESQLTYNTRQMNLNLDFVRQHIEVSGSACLDVGCGAGVFPALLHRAGAEVSAIEPQPLLRRFCRTRYNITPRPELVDSAHWQQGFPRYFDVVTLLDTLEHVNFPAQTIAGISRVIKPGGHLFLDTPARESLSYRLSEWSYRMSRGRNALMLNSLYSNKRFGHKQIFTRKQLGQLIEDNGFTIIGHSTLHRSKNKHVIVCQKN